MFGWFCDWVVGCSVDGAGSAKRAETPGFHLLKWWILIFPVGFGGKL